MARVASLYRVSTGKQGKIRYGEEITLPGQKEVVGEFLARQQGWHLVASYEEMGSAFTRPFTKRKELQRLVADAESGLFDVLVVPRGDRLSREGYPYLEIINTFNGLGVEIWDALKGIRLSLEEDQLIMRSLEAYQNNQESRKTRERVLPRMNQLAASGRWTGGRVVFGYELVHVKDEQGQYVVIGGKAVRQLAPSQYAPLVVEAYQRYLRGEGTHRLAAWLNSIGVPAVAGGLWSKETVRGMLSNPLYAGYVRYNHGRNGRPSWGKPMMTDGKHPAIIDRDTWQAVQDLLALKAGMSPRQRESVYVLTGIAKCGKCGSSLNGVRHYRTLANGERATYYGYRCAGWSRRGLCDFKHGSALVIEENFVDALCRLVEPTETEGVASFLAEREAARKAEAKAAAENRKRMRSRLAEIEQALKELRRAYLEAHTFTDGEFKEAKEAYQQEQAGIESQLASAPVFVTKTAQEYTVLAEEVLRVRDSWDHLTPQERKTVALNLVAHFELQVLVYPDKRVELLPITNSNASG